MAASQLSLLKQKRFLPFFITQALGALNDNVYKVALLIIFTFQLSGNNAAESGILNNVSAILFILPFFLFSPISGQLADKLEKSAMIRRIKLFEITIMILAAAALYFKSPYMLLGILFLLGFQSSLFAPVKYGILPQHLKETELVSGNGLVSMGTFLAINIGNIIGGNVTQFENGTLYITIIVLIIALLGYISSRSIPYTPAVAPDIKINFNIATEVYRNFSFIRKNRVVFLSILGISWFWFFGATILTQLPNYAKFTLGGDNGVFTLLLTAFSLGIGAGALACAKLSGERVEIGLVPLGAIGMTLFTIDLYFANNATGLEAILSAQEFMQTPQSWRVLIDATLIGVFGGLYIVPLNALIQQRSERSHLSRVIAGNNIFNALFMVLSGAMAVTLISLDFSVPEIILITGVLNAVISLYIFTLVPEFIMRFLIWIFISFFYRIKKRGLANIPDKGSCVIVSNHISFMDAMIIGGISRRPVRFVMDHRIFKTPILSFIFRTAGAIPIAPARENPEIMEKAFDKIAEYLDNDEVVCIFPEGKLTSDGEINPFKNGIEKIIQRTPVPVVPMALQGLWGSFFSRKDGPAMGTIPRRFWSKVGFIVGEPVPSEEVSANDLFDRVAKLRGDSK